MPDRLFRFYQRKRIVNINVNIAAAGLLAILVAKWPVQWFGDWIGTEKKFIITLAAIAIDIVVDVLLYYVLHWIANNWRPLKHETEAERYEDEQRRKRRPFVRDATIIQLERIILSPIYYVIAGGLTYAFQHAGLRPGLAFAAGFCIGIVCTRIVHTVWGLRTGRFD